MAKASYWDQKNEDAALFVVHKKLYPHLYRNRASQEKIRKNFKL